MHVMLKGSSLRFPKWGSPPWLTFFGLLWSMPLENNGLDR
jgi:hypothetical protein